MALLATVSKVLEMTNHASIMAVENLEERVIDLAKPTIIDQLKNGDSDHNRKLVCQAVWNALRDLLASILADDTKIYDVFAVAVNQGLRAKNLAKKS